MQLNGRSDTRYICIMYMGRWNTWIVNRTAMQNKCLKYLNIGMRKGMPLEYRKPTHSIWNQSKTMLEFHIFRFCHHFRLLGLQWSDDACKKKKKSIQIIMHSIQFVILSTFFIFFLTSSHTVLGDICIMYVVCMYIGIWMN